MIKNLKMPIVLALLFISMNSYSQTWSGGYSKKSNAKADTIYRDNSFPHFRFAITGGFSALTAPLSSDIPSYLTSFIGALSTGGNFSTEFNYFWNRRSGFGLKYNVYLSATSATVNYPSSGGGTIPTFLSADEHYTFIGPEYYSRILSRNKKGAFIAGIGLGYMNYYAHVSNGSADVIQTGNTLGITYDLAYDYALNDNLSIGIQLSVIRGTLYQYDEYDGTTTKTVSLSQGSYQSLDHLDISIGIRYTPVQKVSNKNIRRYP